MANDAVFIVEGLQPVAVDSDPVQLVQAHNVPSFLAQILTLEESEAKYHYCYIKFDILKFAISCY